MTKVEILCLIEQALQMIHYKDMSEEISPDLGRNTRQALGSIIYNMKSYYH